MEERRRALGDHGWLARVWSAFLKLTVGYGYYPSRPALWWLAILTLLGFALFWAGYHAGNMVPTEKEAYSTFENDHRPPPYYGSFHALIYSFENSFQIVKLGQADRWQPEPYPHSFGRQSKKRLAWFFRPIISPWFLLWFRWIQIMSGWFFTTLALAGVVGIVRKE
jgi:hypothetical protein